VESAADVKALPVARKIPAAAHAELQPLPRRDKRGPSASALNSLPPDARQAVRAAMLQPAVHGTVHVAGSRKRRRVDDDDC
jgi:hypothetical protein